MNSKIQLTFNYSQKSLKISHQYYIVINKEYRINTIALIETGTNLNCRREGLISTKYFAKKTKEQKWCSKLNIQYKFSNALIYNQRNMKYFHISQTLFG